MDYSTVPQPSKLGIANIEVIKLGILPRIGVTMETSTRQDRTDTTYQLRQLTMFIHLFFAQHV